MRKEEDENTPGLGPIEDYLHAVATERKLPDLAVGICTLRIEDAAPKLRTLLDRSAGGGSCDDGYGQDASAGVARDDGSEAVRGFGEAGEGGDVSVGL